MNFLYGIIIILVISGMYQTIYLLNNHLKSKFSDDRKKEIEGDIQKFGSCCGNTESCTLPAKIESLKKDIILSFPESIIETSAGVEKEKNKN
jgi:hypothetical protein